MHHRQLELDKIKALCANKEHFDSSMTLSTQSREESTWWVNHTLTASKPICHGNPDLILTTDASNQGWGPICEETSSGGFWNCEEQRNHINYLELQALLLRLQSLCVDCSGKNILVQSDDTSTVSYINAMGGIKSFTMQWHSNHVMGLVHMSQHLTHLEHYKSQQNGHYLKRCSNAGQTRWGMFKIDVFASRLHCRIAKYVRRSDPGAQFINALFMNWHLIIFMPFHFLFSLIAKCLQKIKQDQSTGFLIVQL